MIVINGQEIKINRETAVISEMDRAYMALVKEILANGVRTHNRTGIDTIAIAGWNYKFDLSKAFPIAESKKVIARNFSSEIQWIHQEQSNRIAWLTDRDNHTWDLWEVNTDGIYRTYEQGENAVFDPERMVPLKRKIRDRKTGVIKEIPMYDKYGKEILVKSWDVIEDKADPRTIKSAIWFGEKYAGTDGEAYGFLNKKYHMPQRVEWTIKNNPTDRRMNINLWQEAHLTKAVLPSCVWSIEFKVTPDGKLHAYVHQRSADVPVGLPFNISQYALLVNMYAKACGLEVGTMSWSIMDAHIYVNQIPDIQRQVRRYNYMEEYEHAIQTSTDEEIERLYNKTCELYENIHKRVVEKLTINVDGMPMSKRYKALSIKKEGEQLARDYEEAFERKVSLEHMLTRETPVLELASHDSIFEYSTDYVQKGDKYLNENPIGNKELVLKHYHSTPFISMPIAQ